MQRALQQGQNQGDQQWQPHVAAVPRVWQWLCFLLASSVADPGEVRQHALDAYGIVKLQAALAVATSFPQAIELELP